MLRGIGASVEPRLARIGQGVPDLLVGFRGTNTLLETKTGERDCDRKLTKDEQNWHERWSGQCAIVSTPDEAVEVVIRTAKGLGRI